jgi:hypothetical protein
VRLLNTGNRKRDGILDPNAVLSLSHECINLEFHPARPLAYLCRASLGTSDSQKAADGSDQSLVPSH